VTTPTPPGKVDLNWQPQGNGGGPSFHDPTDQGMAQLAKSLAAPITDTIGALGNIAKTFALLVEIPVRAMAWLANRHNWLRILWFLAGLGLVWAGAVVLFRHPIIAVVKNGAKAGAAAAI
jgi:type IV secretory pathway VirB2 component (pilin)